LLIDLANGRSLPLAPVGERSGRVAFSPDGRWMVFYLREGPRESQTSTIYRIDLTSPDLEIEPFYENASFSDSPGYSSRGDLAIVARDDDGTSRAAVLHPDGSVHRLQQSGHVTSWSPDGRYLTYEEPYREGELIDQYLVDTQDWSERKIGESGPCNCDGNPRPVWAPDSSKFIYTYLVGEVPDGYAVSEVHFPDARPPVQVEDDRGWLDADRYIIRVYDEDSYDIVAVSLTTGARTPLFENNPRDRSLWMSPNHDLSFTEGTLLNSQGDVVASVPGGFRRWSPDGQHIVTFSNGTSCGRGYRVQAIDGTLIGCGPYPPEGSPFNLDLTNDAFAYVVPTDIEVEFAENAYVLDFATGKRTQVLADFVAASYCVQLSPDSRFLVVGHACGL
jgi:Tol biopolymer transport system component